MEPLEARFIEWAKFLLALSGKTVSFVSKRLIDRGMVSFSASAVPRLSCRSCACKHVDLAVFDFRPVNGRLASIDVRVNPDMRAAGLIANSEAEVAARGRSPIQGEDSLKFNALLRIGWAARMSTANLVRRTLRPILKRFRGFASFEVFVSRIVLSVSTCLPWLMLGWQ
jgi:hypothetical protein